MEFDQHFDLIIWSLLRCWSSWTYLLSLFFHRSHKWQEYSDLAINEKNTLPVKHANHHTLPFVWKHANILPLWHWWQPHDVTTPLKHLKIMKNMQLYHCDNATVTYTLILKSSHFLPLWHQCQRNNMLPLSCCSTYSPCQLWASWKYTRYSISTPPDQVNRLDTIIITPNLWWRYPKGVVANGLVKISAICSVEGI